jgi:hypothetical protein
MLGKCGGFEGNFLVPVGKKSFATAAFGVTHGGNRKSPDAAQLSAWLITGEDFRSGLPTDGSTAPPSVSEARFNTHAANDVHLKPSTRDYCGGGVVVVVVCVCSG